MELSDRELVKHICEGREEDFNILYDRYFNRVYNYTLRKVRNPTEAEDLVQEIFYSVFTSLKSFEGRSSLLSWIYGIMKNNINNYFRRNKNSDVPMNDEDRARLGLEKTSPEYGPDLQLEMKEAITSFDRALRALSDSQYQVFRMRHMEDLSITQIAKRTNKSKDSIKSNLYRIKKLLTPGGGAENQSLAWV